MPQPSPEYARLDALPADESAELQALVSDGLPEAWRYNNPSDLLWFVSVLVDERDACYIGLSRPSADQARVCPLTLILDATDLHYTSTATVGDGREWRELFISTDSDAVDVVRSCSGTPDDDTFGRLLGYPHAAVDAYGETDFPRLLSFIESELDIPPAETRYLNLLPYIPAPTEDSVRTGIRNGKRYATLPDQIARDRPVLDTLPVRCPSPPPTKQWAEYVETLTS